MKGASMRRATIVIAAVLSIGVPLTAHAGADKVGTTAANFLTVGVGTDILGMGGATLGLANGINATPWNAASLGWVKETQIAFSHANLTEQSSQEWLVAGGRFGHSSTHWSMSGLYQTEGQFEGRDAFNNPTSNFDVASFAVGAHLAQAFGDRATVGLGAKFVDENLGALRGNGFTFDAGLQMKFGIVGVGLAAQNVFGKVTFAGLRYPFPATYGAGIAVDHPQSGLRAALDVNVPDAYYADVRGGLEWRWKDHVAIRTGYRSELGAPADEALSGPSFGFGAGAYKVWFDYGYLIANHGEAHHRLGFSFNPSQIPWNSSDPFGQNEMPREFEAGKKADASKKSADKPAEKRASNE